MSSTVACLLLLVLLVVDVRGKLMDPDYGADSRKLIKSRGFGFEEHEITTRDGYMLTVFRIVNPYSIPTMPIIIVHGIFSSSRDFLIAGPDGHVNEGTKVMGNNLGFELAKRDYDVWLVNSRGNVYSQNHTKFMTHDKINRDPRFWDFSYADMAQFDVPAVVNHVLRTTQVMTVGYIGHSRGSNAMFAAMSMFPELNKKIRPFIALAPVVFAKHASPLIFNFPIPALLSGQANFPVNQIDLVPEAVKKVRPRFTCSPIRSLIRFFPSNRPKRWAAPWLTGSSARLS